ncbi:MAG: plasmid pRiA4b ORF-3 family protein, partial [Bacteroidota bacterium]
LTKVPKGKSVYLALHLERTDEYWELTNTAQYLYLIETLWIRVDWETLNDPSTRRSPASDCHELFRKIANKGTLKYPPALNHKDLGFLGGYLWPIVGYFEFFGFWEVETSSYDETRYLHIDRIDVSTLGWSMAKIFAKKRRIMDWNYYERLTGAMPNPFDFMMGFGLEEEEPDPDPVKTLLKALKGEKIPKKKKKKKVEPEEELDFASLGAFPTAFETILPKAELQKTIFFTPEPPKKGTYILKLRFKHYPEVWRRLSLPWDATLEDLHLLIQQAVQFDNDHLYAFSHRLGFNSRAMYTSPWDNSGIPADETRIGDIQFLPPKPFYYIFDFGDNWQFEIFLEEIKPETKAKQSPTILESQGDAPAQYHFYEDEEW